MKKYIFKFFLISLFTCLSFFSIDKVYAYNYPNWLPETVVIDGVSQRDSWVSSNINLYGIRTAPNTSQTHHIVFDYNLRYQGLDSYFNITFVAYSDDVWDYVNHNPNGSLSITWRAATINYGGACDVSSVGTDKWYLINCKDVRIQTINHLYLDVYINFSNSNIKTNNLFGISGDFYTSTSPEQNMIDAINGLNSNQVITNQQLEETKQAIQDTNDTLKDDDTSEASGEAESFFSGFSTDTHGLTSIITAPLNLIGNIASSSCSPLPLDIPFVEGKKLNLPCMSSIYKKHFGNFLTVYQIATFGLVAYWVCVRIFNLVKDFKNPDHDEVEVMDL